MFGTLITLAFAALLLLYPKARELPFSWEILSILLIVLSAILFLAQYVIFSYTLRPMQKAEKNVTPRVMQLFQKDKHLSFARFYSALFPILTFLFAASTLFFKFDYKIELLALWIVLLGIGLDLTHHSYKRILTYLDPYSVIKKFTHAAQFSVQEEKEEDLCDWIDALTDSSIIALQRSNISLCIDALNELQVITRNFLHSSKSISHHATDKQSEKMGISDKVSFTLFYLFQRLELINEKAIEYNLEPASSAVITTLGKITVHAAKYDLSLASYPIYILGKCAKRAQETKFPEVANKANLTLLEVAKTIPEEIDITYLELQDPYFTLITQLHEIANESFRQDKTTPIASLTQPFKELRTLFETDKLAKHQDTPVIIENIKQIQAEFDALELIMKTIPPIPDIPEEPPSQTPTPPLTPPEQDQTG